MTSTWKVLEYLISWVTDSSGKSTEMSRCKLMPAFYMEKNGRNERQLILLISDTILEFGSEASMQGRPYFSVRKGKSREWGKRKERKARGRGGVG